MAIVGTLGSKVFISDDPLTEAVDTEAEYTAQDWTEISLIESVGDFGKVFDLATFQAVGDGRMRKLKAGYNEGQASLVLGQDLSNDGQAALKDAAEVLSQDNYGFRIELNDAPAGGLGAPTTFLFRGLVTSFRTTMGNVGQVVKASVAIEVNSDIIHVGPSGLQDFFVSGGSLAHYHLFNGSDAEAVDPVIAGNALSLVTGNAGTGVAADGSQAITDVGYTLSGGPVTVEARIKLSAITNVALFFGLTDQKAALEIPIESAASGDTITTNATDAVGFMFDTAMATDTIWFVGVNNNTDDPAVDSELAFVANTYRTLRIVIAADGDADFYINGNLIDSITTACRTTVPLYPTVIASARATASRTVTVDSLSARQN